MASFTAPANARVSPRGKHSSNHIMLQKSIEHRAAYGLGRAKTKVPDHESCRDTTRRNLTNKQELQGHRYHLQPIRTESRVTLSSVNANSNFVWTEQQVGQKMAEKPRTYRKGGYPQTSPKTARDQHEVKEDLAKMHRGDDRKYMRINGSAETMQLIQGTYSDGGHQVRDPREKALDIVPTVGVITKPFNRLGGRNAAEVEAEMKAVHSSKQEEKEKFAIKSKMEAHKRLFYSDPTAYYGQESVLESQGLGTRKPRLQAKQTSVYTKHLKSSIGSW